MIDNPDWNIPRSAPNDTPSGPSSVLNISQAEISRLKQIRLKINQLKQEGEQLRCSIRDRLIAGALVEPGRYRTRIVEQSVRSLSSKKLSAVFGPEYVQQLKSHILPTISQRLVIDEVSDEGGMDRLLGAEA